MNSTLFLDTNDFARHTAWLHWPMANYAEYGLGFFAVLMLFGWWHARSGSDRDMASALLAPLLAIMAFLINQPIASIVAERRPYDSMQNVLVLVGKSHGWSFPSDHATVGAAVTIALFFVSKRLGYISLFFALLMAAARVYVGVHYPGDVLAGLLGGAFAAASCRYVFIVPVAKTVRRLRLGKLKGILLSS